ncbi:M20/M25/M40 family metallo-hydrolase [Sporosarcina sp. ACRSL]|uniref:M20/M25/M40 family metallo-hydrolase n=1 Tax=Sporosarcina sp. ACRSL TaxID=2918215 RepID=UPI001EF641E2|nr:M20/M25/M40 family metallo-hydrolase [Sporosarcina sp. ACRSL]MCG7344129.1 M20/M25/M40 family metallo-hydrolase [Sporosarcina sp. ACRSL]
MNMKPEIVETVKSIATDEKVKEALAFLEADNDATTNEQIELTGIEAPTFEEWTRGKVYQEKLRSLGIEDIQVDEVGNVFGIRKGAGNGPSLVLCAHLDTVFPAGTDVQAKWVDGKVYAPGISDDGRGLAVVLTILRALNHAGIETKGDLIVGATVGEEGLGDLHGVKHLFSTRNDIDGFISVEPGAPERITYLGTGSKRYSVTYKGPGGHSFGSFGTANPIHALGRAIAGISVLETPADPKTTYNVGVISGGTSVNTISETAKMIIDLRSNSEEELANLEAKVLEILQQAAVDENTFRGKSDEVTVEIEQVGDRPAGSQSPDADIVQASMAAVAALGFEPVLGSASSTDSNVPINLGVPAVTLNGGGEAGGIHTLNEYYDPTNAHFGPQTILLTVLALLGYGETAEPVLPKRQAEVAQK